MALALACDDGAAPTVLRLEGVAANVTFEELWDIAPGGGAGVVTGDANGDAIVSDFITEHVAGAEYTVLLDIEFGDSVNALSFLSAKESVYFTTGIHPIETANSTLTIDRSMWNIDAGGDFDFIGATVATATLVMTNSIMLNRNNFTQISFSGSCTFTDVLLLGSTSPVVWKWRN